jgi:hypothetical protein
VDHFAGGRSLFVPEIGFARNSACGNGTSFCGHYYLDNQYHIAGSWLGRFSWFTRKQQLHFIHHRHGNCNFALIGGKLPFLWSKRTVEAALRETDISPDDDALSFHLGEETAANGKYPF